MSEAVGTVQRFICLSHLLKCNTIFLAEETMSKDMSCFLEGFLSSRTRVRV